jgi:hypothetical protein
MKAFVGVLSAATVVLVAVSPAPALAQNAPAALRGKSVTASWTEERVQRTGDQTEFQSRSVGQSLSVYISSEGRAFAKRTVSTTGGGRGRGGVRAKTGSAETVGDNTGHGPSTQFRGNTLIFTNQFGGGARMARIEFDQSFSSCTATVIVGRENGRGTAHAKALNSGKSLEIASATVSGTSCSIQSGNVFAQ